MAASPLFRMAMRRSGEASVLLILLVAGWSCGALSEESSGSQRQAEEQASQFVAQGFELLSRDEAAGAEQAFRRAIEAQPEMAAAHRGLGLALWALGKGSAALRELTVATRLVPEDAESQFDLGTIAWKLSARPDLAGDEPTKLSPSELQGIAVAAVSRAVTLRPDAFGFRMTLAQLYLDAQRPQDAMKEATQALPLAPSQELEAAAHTVLARASWAAGEEIRAESEFRAALEIDPSSAEAYFGLGQIRVFQRRPAEALALFSRAAQAAPDFAPAHAAIGEVLIVEGRPREARQALEKAVSLDPGDWQSQFRLARLLMDTGEVARASELLEKVHARQPDFLPARELLGLTHLRRGDVREAEALAARMLAEEPRAAEGHRVMALVHWQRRETEFSLSECAQALAADPDSSMILALQALGLWQLGRKREAQDAFVQAARLQPQIGSAEVFCRLILCGTRDIGVVHEFLRKNRWVLLPRNVP